MTAEQRLEAFNRAWITLAAVGACDTYRGMQYHRIVREWLQAGEPEDVSEYIVREANSPAPSTPADSVSDQISSIDNGGEL